MKNADESPWHSERNLTFIYSALKGKREPLGYNNPHMEQKQIYYTKFDSFTNLDGS